MTDARALAAAYLLPPAEACWCWTEDAAAVTWADGHLMALREELEAAASRLQKQGLPPFGAMALLLSAAQECWLDPGGGREHLVRYLGHVARAAPAPAPPGPRRTIRIDMRRGSLAWARDVKNAARHQPRPANPARALEPYDREGSAREQARKKLSRPALARDLLAGLDRVHALPPRLRGTVGAKALLAELVFEPSTQRLSAESSAAVVQELCSGADPAQLAPPPVAAGGLETLLADVEALLAGLGAIDEERVEMRARTGLDRPLDPHGKPVPPPEQVRNLLGSLLGDSELAGLAKLSLSLMAAVHVPRALSTSEELQLGGVSDLTNRGPLDRLLVSELAHDDLTLAVRIALNEALYLRREAPPRNPPVVRGILLDSGIRLWGVPRLFATAAALALAATGDPRGRLRAWRASGDRVHPVDLTTRDGLTAHLEALETEPHPGAALAPFLDELAREGEPHDAVLVTHARALADPGFMACLAACGHRGLHVATIDRDGAFALSHVTERGARPIGGARLSLEGLGAPAAGKSEQPLVAPGFGRELPLALSVEPFPLLVPLLARFSHSAVSRAHGLASVTEDGRVLHWFAADRGPRELTAQVPPGRVHGMHLDDEGTVRVVAGRAPGGRIPMLIIRTGAARASRCELQTSASSMPLVACWQSGALLLVFPARVDVFDPATGERILSTEALPEPYKWVSGRFFHGAGGWKALAFDGQALRFEPVPVELPHTMALFDREGLDGPWGITLEGQVFSTIDGAVVPMPSAPERAIRFVAASSDGQRVAIQVVAGDQPAGDFVIDLARQELGPAGSDLLAALEGPVHPAAAATGWHEVRHRFRAAGISGAGQLVLESRSGSCVTPGLTGGGDLVLEKLAAAQGGCGRLITFEPIEVPPGVRYRLHRAGWPDGSAAFLDSRGLLHLKSADRRLPETTLVLAAGPIGGWTSDGKLAGCEYFTGDPESLPASALLAHIDRFVQVAR